MRLTVEIDEALMKKAMRLSGAKSRRETVEKALQLLVRVEGQKPMRTLRGKLHWEGDLKAMRKDRLT